jgi:hypothetical protein
MLEIHSHDPPQFIVIVLSPDLSWVRENITGNGNEMGE